MDFPTLLKELRDAGMTQVEIASAAGVTQPTISDLASGKTKKPSFDLGNKLQELHRKVSRRLARAA